MKKRLKKKKEKQEMIARKRTEICHDCGRVFKLYGESGGQDYNGNYWCYECVG